MKRYSYLFKFSYSSYLFALCLLPFALFAQVPIAQYSFTGNANDLSTFGNNATINGATPTQDRFGFANSAFAFDGVQSAVTAKNAAQLNSGKTTISFWVKVNKLPGQGEVYLLSHGGWQERWKISLPSHGRPVFTTNSAAGIKDMDTDSVSLPVGAWRQLVMVHDGTNDKIYVNGVLKKSVAVAGDLNNTTKPLGIGWNPIDTANYFNGSIDEVTIYNSALTDVQITALYTAQSLVPTVAAGRVASYSFKGSGFDSSSFANHATLTNVKATTDRFGYGASAYEFNGTSSNIKASNSAQLNSPATSISFWVKVNALPTNGEVFLLSNGGWQERWKISLPGHGKPVFTTNETSGISDMDAGDGNALPVGIWKHVMMTHDGVNDKIFIDGVKKATKAVVGNLNNTTKPLGIGFDPIDNGSYFNGSLDEVQIYNYAFAEADVTALYAAQAKSPGAITDIVADYRLNGDGKDYSQYGNDASGRATGAANRFGLGGNALTFSGVDSLVAPNSVALQSDSTTISFWIKVKALPAQGEVYLLSQGGWQERWKISLPSHGKPVFTTNSTGGIKDMDSDSVPLPVGAWRHVVMTHDTVNNKIYINGVLKKSIAAGGPLNKTKYPFGIGYNPIDGGSNFNGDIDDIIIYRKALSAAEVTTLYGVQSTAPVYGGTLVASYPFSNSGADVTSYANNADVSTAVPTKDRFGKANKAYAFNNSVVKAGNSVQLNSPNATISFWVNVKQLPAQGEMYILSHGGYQERFKISLPSHGKPVFTTNSTAGIKDMDTDSVSLTVGVWRHVVMTHDGATNKIYINGVLKNSKPDVGSLNNTTKPLGIGYDPIDSANFFNGSLDEVQIYNVALNATEVTALYVAQSTAPTDPDTQAPSAPLNLAAVVAFTNVTLSWLPSTDNVGVIGYNVYQNNSIILNVSTTSTLLKGLKPTTTFNFGVSAVDAAGNESAVSSLSVTTGQDAAKDTIKPTVPTNLAAALGSNSVQLTWTASTDNRAVVGYIVSQDGVVIDTVLSPLTAKFVGGLTALTSYTFDVLAYDAAGNKSANAEITVTTLKAINTGEPGLIANYTFDGNANDATPYLNHGVSSPGVKFITRAGATGQAVKFSGKDSIVIKNAVQLISDYTTYSFWIRVDSLNIADAEAYIIDFGHWSQRMKISLPQHLKIVFTTNSKNAQFANAISDMDAGGGNELIKGIWWYVTMVHDGTNDLIYVNGVLVNTKPAAGKLNNTARILGIGNNPIDGGQYFNGALDNLKIYNKALTAAEVAKLFATGSTPVNEQTSAELKASVKSISPNPTSDILTVNHSFNNTETVLVRVFDLLGREIDAVNFGNQIPLGQFSLNVSKYPQGTYLINFVKNGESLGALKFIKN